MPSTYTFKSYNNGQYSDETDNLVSKEVLPINNEEKWAFLNITAIKEILISQKSLEFFEELISVCQFSEHKDLLFSLGINLQVAFLEFSDIYSDEILDNFKSEDKEYKMLLDVLELYLFNNDNNIHSISFKFQKTTKPTKAFKSKTLKDDILNAILIHLNINAENFQDRKKQILSESIHIVKEKGGEYIRTTFVQNFFHFIKTQRNWESENAIFRFIRCFLLIFQIPYSSSNNEIHITSIEEELKSIDISIMKHYIDRPKNIFTK